MNVKKITVITLTYNNWEMIDKAITSLIKQKIHHELELEYIIADDGTINFDERYISRYLDKYEINYKIIKNKKNIGTVKSFNNAISISNGDIIIPLSADDEFYDDNVIMDIVKSFRDSNSYIITGLRALKDIDNEILLPSKKDWILFDKKEKLLKKIMIHGNIISGAATCYHRDIFSEIGFFDEKYRLLEDYPFYIKALSKGYNIFLLKKPIIMYGMNGISSNNISPILKKDHDLVLSVILNNNSFSFFERRFIIYNRLLNKKERLKLSLIYIEQSIPFIIKKIKLKLKALYD
ncbi:glycosyltransferase [Photobacterium leiognathi]|uniref:glycosyltransferase n=1 Tax=Photobacterium leiognathi TaxID=553611 RepID=UPI001EDEA055|nr:glycosyltransferase [Photobacterium leiognathi]MCG3886785.1 glycosyltransferase [Photobacterium leiognathi]